MSPYSALLFDFDYTLADSSAGIVECVNCCFQQMRLPPASRDAVSATIGLALPETLRRLAGPQSEERVQEFVRRFVARADQVMVASTVLLEAAHRMLLDLDHGGIPLGIVTTKFRRRIDEVLAREGLRDRFAVIVGGDDVRQPKPDPEGLLLAVAALSARPASTLYVGDSPADAEAARRAGVPFAAVLSGVTPREAFAPFQPVAVLDSVAELPAWLRAVRATGS
jgi:phosphoglycolate phosphatase